MQVAMRVCLVAAHAAAVGIALLARPSFAQDFRPPTPEEVQTAIAKGKRWLVQAQREDGSWGPCRADGFYGEGQSSLQGSHDAYPVGPTAFTVFALAKCGVTREDRAVQKALHWLDNKAPQLPGDEMRRCTSYETAALILMLTSLNEPLPPPRKGARRPKTPVNPRLRPEGSSFRQVDWTWMHWLVERLLACQARGGCWGYYGAMDYEDVSATQFALLALRDATRAGYPVDSVAPDLWTRAAQGLRALQEASGAFRYHKDEGWSAGRTAAAVSSLLICKERLACAGGRVPEWLDAAVEKGTTFLGDRFDVTCNAADPRGESGGQYHYCHLYAIERLGALSGKRELGGKAWYPRGAAYLIARQGAAGDFADVTCMTPKDVLGTCFALLFLRRATPPVTTGGR